MEADTSDGSTARRDRLELISGHVELLIYEGNITRRPVSHFLDFVINGQSLIGLLRGGGDYVTNLNRAWVPDVVPVHVAVLLGRQPDPELDPGRVPLIVCAVDGDIACGAVTAALSVAADTVTWSDFRWEDGYRALEAPEGLPDAVTFDRREYELGLQRAVVRVSELPHDETEHRLRRFLWPWHWGWRLPRDN